MPPRSPSPSPSRGSHGDGEYDTELLAPGPSHPAPPSPAFTNSTIYRTPDDDYSDADTDITGRDGIATPVTVSVSGDNHSPPSGGGGRGLRYEDLPPSYEEAQWQSQSQSQPQQFHAYEQHQQHATLPANPLSPPPSFAESFHTPVGGGNANASDPVLPAVERLVIREKERAASEQGGSERSAFSGSGDGGSNGFSFAAVEGLASEHHGALEVALQWAHPAYHVGDQKEPLSGAALARPVAVPQVNVAEEPAGGDVEEDEEAYGPANILSFSRAYAPALQQAHGVSLPIFVSFLDGLNAVCHAARAPATDAEASDVDLSLVETYLARANALFFAQRGLLVRVVDVDGLLDDVLRISTSRRSLRDALAGDVTRNGASERERVDALDPWVERLSWEGLPPATLRLWDLRGHQHQEQQQQAQEQQRTGNIGAPTTADFVPTATAAATTPAYASGEFYSNPPGVAGGYLDEKAQARAWADSSQPPQQHQQDQAGPSSSHNPPAHPFPPFPPLGPFPGFGPPPPMNHFADGARWSDWGQGVGRRWADWGQQLGRGWAMWGQEVGSRAAQLGQDVGRGVVDETRRAGAGPWGSAGRGAFLGGGRGHWGGGPGGGGHRGPQHQHQHQHQHQQQWGPWGPYGYGLGGRRGFGFAGRGRGPPGMGMGMGMGMGPGMGVGMGPGMGMGGHQLRGGWGPGGGWQQPGTFSGFGQGAHHHQHEAERSAEAMPTGSSQQNLHHHPGGSYESTTTLGSSHISLEDNDRDDNDSDRDGSDADDDSDSDSDLDEIEVSFLKRMRSIEDAAADALAKGKRSPGDVARERDKHMDKAKAERTKAERKLEARRKKDEGKREMKAKKKEWKESRQAYRTSTAAGKGKAEGKGKRKAEKKALRKEWKEARGKWREGRREERVERKGERKEKRAERRSGGGGGGGCGARQAEQPQPQPQPQAQAQQQSGVEVGVVAAGDGGVSSSAPRSLPPQLLWVVVENLEN